MNEVLKVDAAEYGIEQTVANDLTTGLRPVLDERKLLIDRFEQVKDLPMTEENVTVFRELRLKFRDNRTKGINKWHETTKQMPLRMGQLIDAIKRVEVQTNETHEEILERGEKHFENLERQRIDAVRSNRWYVLSAYMDVEPQGLGVMADQTFDMLIAGARTAHEAKVQAEIKAEEDRIAREKAEAEARESQRLENMRLKAEADVREAAIAEERRIQAEVNASLVKEQKRIHDQAEAAIKAERDARQKAEASIEAQRLAEEKARKQAEAEAKKAAKAPVKIKMKNAVNSLEMPILQGLTSDESATWEQILSKHAAFKQWASIQIEQL